MEWNQLKYFYEVAKRGSFTKASQALRISQPSLSKMVSQLERDANCFFLERNKKGVRLTPMGKILFEGFERVLKEFEAVETSISKKKLECSGLLSIGASDNVCNYLFPDLLAAFQKEHPHVSIKVVSGTSKEIRAHLKDFNVELGFFYTPVREKELQTSILSDIEFVIVAARAIKLDQLKKNGYIGSQEIDYTKPYVAMKLLRSMGLNPEVRVESNSLETQKRLAISGLGFTVVPRPMVIEELSNGTLKEIKAPKKLTSPLYLVKRQNRPLSEAAARWEKYFQSRVN